MSFCVLVVKTQKWTWMSGVDIPLVNGDGLLVLGMELRVIYLINHRDIPLVHVSLRMG